jgi:hypothetical protein
VISVTRGAARPCSGLASAMLRQPHGRASSEPRSHTMIDHVRCRSRAPRMQGCGYSFEGINPSVPDVPRSSTLYAFATADVGLNGVALRLLCPEFPLCDVAEEVDRNPQVRFGALAGLRARSELLRIRANSGHLRLAA